MISFPLSNWKRFPFHHQMDQSDCGPSCLRMIAEYYGAEYSSYFIRELCLTSKGGGSLYGLQVAAERIGFEALGVKMSLNRKTSPDESVLSEMQLPCIAHWDSNHFVVIYKIDSKHIWVANPASKKELLSHTEFLEKWIKNDQEEGFVLLLEPGKEFTKTKRLSGKFKRSQKLFLSYLNVDLNLILQLFVGLIVLAVFQFIIPFLTQSIIDHGIKYKDINFINLILLGQLMLFFGLTSVRFTQSWILLHIGNRFNISLVFEFLTKLMKLPMFFFTRRGVGDLLQRINDNYRLEALIKTALLDVIYALITLITLGAVVYLFSVRIFLVVLAASFSYFLWLIIFLEKRKEVDYEIFREQSKNQAQLIELIQGMREIKLQNSENKRRKKWIQTQIKLYQANIRALTISQYQDAGATFINQLKDIIITIVAAKAVIAGSLTLGMMLAIQYIIGQISLPLIQLANFIKVLQDGVISMERLNEIYSVDAEETDESGTVDVPSKGDIVFKNVWFRYDFTGDYTLKDLNFQIPYGKTTAIVGASGSGKTTIIKLLLGFYKPTMGEISLNDTSLDQINKKDWRKNIGAVMQESFIFSDTIANNIAESEESQEGQHDPGKLQKAIEIANAKEFLEDSSISVDTMIGNGGVGISKGQRQRLLIARAVYKNPSYLFFDEATNALDSRNEKLVSKNLQRFFHGRTLLIVAHRLNTIINADQIIVLKSGMIQEVGTHQELFSNKGEYYLLVKDQMKYLNTLDKLGGN